jgi:hypothetical protein
MKSAVEQFAIALYEGGYLQGNGDEIQNLLEQHLETEKERMIEFAWECQEMFKHKIKKHFEEKFNIRR